MQDIETLKIELREAKRQRKLQKREGRKLHNITKHLDYYTDSVILRVCEPFEKKASSIRYKRNDPDGYEADQLVIAVRPIINHLERKTQKNKQLSERDKKLLLKIKQVLSVIQEKGIGNYLSVTREILGFIDTVMINNPVEIPAKVSQLADMANALGKMVESLTGEKVKPINLTSDLVEV